MSASSAASIPLPPAPALVAGGKEAAWLSEDGEIERLPAKEAARRLAKAGPVYCCLLYTSSAPCTTLPI